MSHDSLSGEHNRLTSSRYLSLDVLKAAGIAYLVCLHQMVWHLTLGDGGDYAYPQAKVVITALGYRSGSHVLGFQVPLLAGATFYLATRRGKWSIVGTVRRALILAGLGFAMNALTWGPQDTLAWDVLPFIGLSMIITVPLIRMKRMAVGIGGVALLSAAALFGAEAFPFPEWSGVYAYVPLFGAPGHYWPLFPWYAVFGAGVMIGVMLERSDLQSMMRRMILLAGVVFVVLSVVRGEFFPTYAVPDIWGFALFKPSALFVLGVIGFDWIMIPLLEWGTTVWPGARESLDNGVVRAFSRGILWIYLLTTVVGYPLSQILVGLMGDRFSVAVTAWIAATGLMLAFSYVIGGIIVRKRGVNAVRCRARREGA